MPIAVRLHFIPTYYEGNKSYNYNKASFTCGAVIPFPHAYTRFTLPTMRETNDTRCNKVTFTDDEVVSFPHAYARQLLINQGS